jgi:hypothetical protein
MSTHQRNCIVSLYHHSCCAFIFASDPIQWPVGSRTICVHQCSLLAPVSSSSRRVVASVSGLGLGKKQREQRPTSTVDPSSPAQSTTIASTTEQLRYHPFARRLTIASDTLFCRKAACLPAQPHHQQPRGAIFRLAHPLPQPHLEHLPARLATVTFTIRQHVERRLPRPDAGAHPAGSP